MFQEHQTQLFRYMCCALAWATSSSTFVGVCTSRQRVPWCWPTIWWASWASQCHWHSGSQLQRSMPSSLVARSLTRCCRPAGSWRRWGVTTVSQVMWWISSSWSSSLGCGLESGPGWCTVSLLLPNPGGILSWGVSSCTLSPGFSWSASVASLGGRAWRSTTPGGVGGVMSYTWKLMDIWKTISWMLSKDFLEFTIWEEGDRAWNATVRRGANTR